MSFLFVSKERKLSYLALGDSYTIGESVEEADRWPNQLAKALNQKGKMLEDPTIIAKTGWRCDQLRTATQVHDFQEKFDLVSLLIGVNNEFQGWIESKFEPEFRLCLKQAIDHCRYGKAGVFVLSIPDYGYTPFGEGNQPQLSKRIDGFNAICRNVCAEEGVLFLNITDISRKGLEQTELVAADGLHPSAAQYQLWVDRILQKVMELPN